eukprot:2749499-Amphidinium_carterae.2
MVSLPSGGESPPKTAVSALGILGKVTPAVRNERLLQLYHAKLAITTQTKKCDGRRSTTLWWIAPSIL